MADLVVILRKARTPGLVDSKPLARGSSVTTHILAIGSVSADTPEAGPNDAFVELRAGAACWVSIGFNPAAEAVTDTGGSFPMAEGEVREFYIAPGESVATIEG